MGDGEVAGFWRLRERCGGDVRTIVVELNLIIKELHWGGGCGCWEDLDSGCRFSKRVLKEGVADEKRNDDLVKLVWVTNVSRVLTERRVKKWIVKLELIHVVGLLVFAGASSGVGLALGARWELLVGRFKV